MKKMRHIKTTRLYEEFILLMLDIKHIVKEDKLFIFLWVIQPLGTYGIARVRALMPNIMFLHTN